MSQKNRIADLIQTAQPSFKKRDHKLLDDAFLQFLDTWHEFRDRELECGFRVAWILETVPAKLRSVAVQEFTDSAELQKWFLQCGLLTAFSLDEIHRTEESAYGFDHLRILTENSDGQERHEVLSKLLDGELGEDLTAEDLRRVIEKRGDVSE